MKASTPSAGNIELDSLFTGSTCFFVTSLQRYRSETATTAVMKIVRFGTRVMHDKGFSGDRSVLELNAPVVQDIWS
jgi:hypothetical protein